MKTCTGLREIILSTMEKVPFLCHQISPKLTLKAHKSVCYRELFMFTCTYLFVLSILTFEAKNLKQGCVSEGDLQNISFKVQRKRKRVGRALGLDDDNLDVIEEEHRDNISEQSYQILLKWKRKRGTKATYHALARALCDCTVMMKHVLDGYCLT